MSLLNHYRLRERIARLENEDELRKSSISRTAYQIIANSRIKEVNNDDTDLTTKLNNYELYTNKLKQEHSTKLKLHDAKLEASKEEIENLKKQLKNLEPESLTPKKFVKPNSRNIPRRSLQSFDKSPKSNSASPEFTPSRHKFEFKNPIPLGNVGKRLKVASKIKKISLLEKVDKRHGLDDENLNTLNYYQDGNFLEPEVSPPKTKREAGPAFQLERPKKKNIFTIE